MKYSEHKVEMVLGGLFLLIVNLPFLSKSYWGDGWWDDIDPPTAGVLGDFIGGYIGTIFFVLSLVVLLATFRDQKSTNERAAFELRFFELLKFHRENLMELSIGEKSSRRLFVSLVREFRETLKIVRHICDEKADRYTQLMKIDLAYLCFYYGVGPNSTRVLKAALARTHHPRELVDRIIARLEERQKEVRAWEKEEKKSGPVMDIQRYPEIMRRASWMLARISYVPFDGHQSRLAHYYRHLYQLMKYLDTHAPAAKAEYAAIIRGQLSNHEQALLCLNSLSWIGSAWNEPEGYLHKYAMIQNIPEGFFNVETELDLKKAFPDIKFEFEKSGVRVEPNRDVTSSVDDEESDPDAN